jgi:hypothetical protein
MLKVIAIFGSTVEFMFDDKSREMNYLSVEDFVEAYGEDALYGDDMEVEEYEEGRMFKF